jgi:hypothetical protein
MPRIAVVFSVLIVFLLSPLSHAQTIPAQYFGLQSGPTKTAFPTVKFGSYRVWDQSVDWRTIHIGPGSFSFTTLDNLLRRLKQNGVDDNVIYTIGVVPRWASSAQDDKGCDFKQLGGCDLPVDLNSDGSGKNQFFIDFVTAIAQHVNDPVYLSDHAHVKYWEPWNEWYRDPELGVPYSKCQTGHGCSIHATYAQMIRMTEDLRSIVLAIDPSAKILTPSSHSHDAYGASLLENFLHCDDKPYPGSQCPEDKDRGRRAIDILNFHLYEGSGAPEEVKTQIETFLRPVLRPEDLATLPLWSDEGGWGKEVQLPDPDMQAAFVSRYYLLGWQFGISSAIWYEFDNGWWGTLCPFSFKKLACEVDLAGKAKLNLAGKAYQQTYEWMVGNAPTQPCTASGAIYICGFTKPDGTILSAVWDSSLKCSSGTCDTRDYQVQNYDTYYTVADGVGWPIEGGKVKISAKPILLVNNLLPPSHLTVIVH